MADITTITFTKFPTGEIKITLDGFVDVPSDDTLMLEVAMRDDGGVYFFAADADRLQEFMSQREPAEVPGGRP